jgi:hypothetical protein
VDRDEYNDANGFIDGEVFMLNLNSIEEFMFAQCLSRKREEYSLFKNNCTDPVEQCLAELLYPVGGSIFSSDLGRALSDVPGLVGDRFSLPQSKPKSGSRAPWAK